jgi:hypothetical protein
MNVSKYIVLCSEVIGETKRKQSMSASSLPLRRSNVMDVVTKQSLACLSFTQVLLKLGQNAQNSVVSHSLLLCLTLSSWKPL